MKKTLAIFLLSPLVIAFGQSNIVQGEYFFDIDPGIGAGLSLPGIVPSDNVDLSFAIDVSGLPLGSHLMGFRFQDENGLWNITQYQSMLILDSDPLIANDITEVEYFFDTDPGLGLAVKIPIVLGTPIDLSDIIDASILAPGLHILGIRAKNDKDEWGLLESTLVYVSSNDLSTTAIIDKAEYFIDNDPGIDNGVQINVTSLATLDLNELVDISGLQTGTHFVTIRVRSESGEWSVAKSAPFSVVSSFDVTQLEHFIDADPGLGLGDVIPISLTSDTLDYETVVATASLPIGPHTFNARIGQNSDWGITESASFTLCDGAVAMIEADRVCEGENTTFTDLSSNVLSGDTYSWDFDSDGNEDATVVGGTSYAFSNAGVQNTTLTIDRLGCPGISTIQVVIDTMISLSGSVANSVQYGETGFVSGVASGNVQSVRWLTDGSGTFTDTTQLSTEYIPSVRDGVAGGVTLTLSAVHPGSCQIPDISFQMAVTLPSDLEIKVYNAISPNGDGKHDFMEIENIEAFPNNKVVIFNRWGDVVATLGGYNNDDVSFTGISNGKQLPSGTYYYEIDLANNSKLIKGFVTLNH